MHKSNAIRNIILIIIVISVIAICIFSIQNKDNKNNKAKVEMSSNQNNVIKITDKLPLVDEIGKKIKYDEDNSEVQGYYSFVVENTSDEDTNFEIYLDDSEFNNNIHSNFIKVYLTDSNDIPLSGFDGQAVPTYYYLRVSNIIPTGRKLYYGYLKAKESKKYILRVWVGDAYSIDVDSKEFSFKVKVEAD